MATGGKIDPFIVGMSYNSARDELFFADYDNKVVRVMRVRGNSGELREVYGGKSLNVSSVCHMSDSDTLLVGSGEYGPNGNWLVVLSRNGTEWREAHRVQTDESGSISCALSGSRVLIGNSSKYMELFSVESGPRIARLHRIRVSEPYCWFSAMCGSDTLVAMSYPFLDQSVRLHRLIGDRLEELERIQLKEPNRLLWLADRLLVSDHYSEKGSYSVIEFEMSGTRLERRRELVATEEKITVSRMCAVNEGFAIFDSILKDVLYYSFV